MRIHRQQALFSQSRNPSCLESPEHGWWESPGPEQPEACCWEALSWKEAQGEDVAARALVTSAPSSTALWAGAGRRLGGARGEFQIMRVDISVSLVGLLVKQGFMPVLRMPLTT